MTFGNTKTGKTGTSTSDATETAQIKSVESLDKGNDMERGLKNRHVQFIAIGGTIEYDGRRLTSTPTFTPLRTPGDPPAWQDIPDAPLTWQQVKATWAEFEQITR